MIYFDSLKNSFPKTLDALSEIIDERHIESVDDFTDEELGIISKCILLEAPYDYEWISDDVISALAVIMGSKKASCYTLQNDIIRAVKNNYAKLLNNMISEIKRISDNTQSKLGFFDEEKYFDDRQRVLGLDERAYLYW